MWVAPHQACRASIASGHAGVLTQGPHGPQRPGVTESGEILLVDAAGSSPAAA